MAQHIFQVWGAADSFEIAHRLLQLLAVYLTVKQRR
jgi:hypothetical protein